MGYNEKVRVTNLIDLITMLRSFLTWRDREESVH